jgi:hypothetical protein
VFRLNLIKQLGYLVWDGTILAEGLSKRSIKDLVLKDGVYQSARTEASPKSPTICGIEWIFRNPIAREESEPVRVNETHAVS